MADILRDEGLLEKIQVLVAPPQTSSAQKQRPKKPKVQPSATTPVFMVRHGNIQNNPYCDACGDGGSLLCCDRCPSSFHFCCCDPPMEPKDIPTGEWLCRRCGSEGVGEEVPPLFRPLLEQAYTANPLIFDIPKEMQRNDMLPGSSKKRTQRHLQEREEAQIKYCFACNKTSRLGHLVSCDFCPLVFHLDCLDPPLTTPPTSAWMCPLHPEHRTPGFDHPRLTERLRALSDCRTDVQQHSVKIDFINRIAKVPHYKRLTRHHNRRATKVPSAVKALYASPLPEVTHVAPLSESLLTAGELVEWWRWEEEKERREFLAPPRPTLTQDKDEWTRKAVVCHIEHSEHSANRTAQSLHLHPPCQPPDTSSDPPSPMTVTNSPTPDTSFPDFTVFLAAHKLMELSGKGYNSLPNGIVKPPTTLLNSTTVDYNHISHGRNISLTCKSPETTEIDEDNVGGLTDISGIDEKAPKEEKKQHNGLLQVTPSPEREECRPSKSEEESRHSPGSPCADFKSKDKEEVGEEEGEGEGEEEKEEEEQEEEREGKAEEEEEEEEEREEVEEEEEEEEELDSTLQMEEDNSSTTGTSEPAFRPGFVPDISQLDERLVRLLAMQRVQQLFTTEARQREDSPLSGRTSNGLSSHTDPPKYLNGLKSMLLPKPIKPSFSPDILSSAPAILCPISGIGSAYPLQRMVTSIGTGSEMDVCLSHYGHCNFTSSRHACVFYDKVTEEYELINYSEHGLIVDGVLYSCDFSDKKTQEGSPTTPTPLTLDDLSARGTGLRAERARARIEAARKSLEDRERAKHALESALNLAVRLSSQGDSADFSLSRSTNNSASASTPIMLGLKRTPEVVSIPLSKTKKLCLEDTQKNTKRESALAIDTKLPKPDLSRIQLGSKQEYQAKGQPHSSSVLQDPDQGTSLSNVMSEEQSKPCLCKRSASSLVGGNGKGWEGTAILFHGSRLRFGCVQFVLSIAGRPGHSELVHALGDLNRTSNSDST